MTKQEFDSLKTGVRYAVRYQYLGRKIGQFGFKSISTENKMILVNADGKKSKYVSYKSVDLIK